VDPLVGSIEVMDKDSPNLEPKESLDGRRRGANSPDGRRSTDTDCEEFEGRLEEVKLSNRLHLMIVLKVSSKRKAV
jgi:hypothetical protein